MLGAERGWPDGGEIDIMEHVGNDPETNRAGPWLCQERQERGPLAVRCVVVHAAQSGRGRAMGGKVEDAIFLPSTCATLNGLPR
ncbi:hypothetical protein [Sphingomonas gilva]|uniref:hypothetical protein n=1 Tax=Sphingomonas gilva TaxID=2305907 RepID=UPI0015FC8BFA|nr:hypothetical protein [Sphingomonas gilva]